MTPPLHTFECLTVHPYDKFEGDEGCGLRWVQPAVPVQCPRCQNVYCRDLTPYLTADARH